MERDEVVEYKRRDDSDDEFDEVSHFNSCQVHVQLCSLSSLIETLILL